MAAPITCQWGGFRKLNMCWDRHADPIGEMIHVSALERLGHEGFARRAGGGNIGRKIFYRFSTPSKLPTRLRRRATAQIFMSWLVRARTCAGLFGELGAYP